MSGAQLQGGLEEQRKELRPQRRGRESVGGPVGPLESVLALLLWVVCSQRNAPSLGSGFQAQSWFCVLALSQSVAEPKTKERF